tara:strand:+ start:5103 stop:5981 length:879 start_codon:yes stop_codon:yes gene_type:complete
MTVKYSIIIPYFNALSTIDTLIKSIPVRDDLEVIVVNDNCSTFCELDISKYKNVRLIDHKNKTKGAGSSRNIGLSYANGEYLLFADADDYFSENFNQVLNDSRLFDYDLIYFPPTSVYYESGEEALRHHYYKFLLSKSNNDELLTRTRFYPPWSKMVKKELIEVNNIKFDEVIASNDINFSLKSGILSKKVFFSDEVIYVVVDSKGSLTKQLTIETLNSRFFAMLDFNDFLDKSGLRKYGNPVFYYLRQYWRFSKKLAVQRAILAMRRKSPIFFSKMDLLSRLKLMNYRKEY